MSLTATAGTIYEGKCLLKMDITQYRVSVPSAPSGANLNVGKTNNRIMNTQDIVKLNSLLQPHVTSELYTKENCQALDLSSPSLWPNRLAYCCSFMAASRRHETPR